MLEGMTVLSETIKSTAGIGDLLLSIFFTLTSLFMLFLMIATIKYWIKQKSNEIVLVLLLFVMAFVLGIISLSGYSYYFSRTNYSQYKVTISDKVSLQEFNSKYEIISIEDKIYTIKLKETQE